MKKIAFIILAFITFSCSKTKTLILKTENAGGITNETKLKIKGVEVGEIENIKLDDDGNVIIIAYLKSELNLPIDSEFKIENEGLISDKIISIKIGKSKEILKEKSTINLMKEDKNFSSDSIRIKIEKVINQISRNDKNDSILKELKRLNKNLEGK